MAVRVIWMNQPCLFSKILKFPEPKAREILNFVERPWVILLKSPETGM